jgi:hypothetical protein
MLPAEQLAGFVRGHPDFRIVTEMDGQYGHMGATLADAVLQAGVKYDSVVRPRIDRLRRDFPEANTTSAFEQLLRERGAAAVLQWNGGRKLETLAMLTGLLRSEGVETEEDFRAWITRAGNLARLREIKGIKDKTAHYIEILLGIQSVAVDRHLFRFLDEAGLPTTNYEEAHILIRDAAAVLGVDASLLDHSIWRYMSRRAVPRSGLPEPRTPDCRQTPVPPAGSH